jgi:hypothetical protein
MLKSSLMGRHYASTRALPIGGKEGPLTKDFLTWSSPAMPVFAETSMLSLTQRTVNLYIKQKYRIP